MPASEHLHRGTVSTEAIEGYTRSIQPQQTAEINANPSVYVERAIYMFTLMHLVVVDVEIRALRGSAATEPLPVL